MYFAVGRRQNHHHLGGRIAYFDSKRTDQNFLSAGRPRALQQAQAIAAVEKILRGGLCGLDKNLTADQAGAQDQEKMQSAAPGHFNFQPQAKAHQAFD